MSWSFVGRQAAGNTVNGATTGTVTLPAGVQGGDFIAVAINNTTGGAATTCSVAGFTALSNQASGGGNAGHDKLWTGYRVAAGAPGSATSDSTFAVTFGANTWAEFDLIVIRSTAGAGTVTYTLHTQATYTAALPDATLSPAPGAGDLTIFGYGGQNAALSGTELIATAPAGLANWPSPCPTLSGNGGVYGMGWGTGLTAPGGATCTVGTAALATLDAMDFAIGVTEVAAAVRPVVLVVPQAAVMQAANW